MTRLSSHMQSVCHQLFCGAASVCVPLDTGPASLFSAGFGVFCFCLLKDEVFGPPGKNIASASHKHTN